MKFLYILYICKWPPVNTVYYFVTSILYKEPAHTCCTDDRKGQVLFMWSKGFYSFNSLVMLIISGFLWLSTKQGLVLVTWCRAGQFPLVNSSFHCSYVSKNRLSIKNEICYIVWILYHVNQKHVELTAVLSFNVILTGLFFSRAL